MGAGRSGQSARTVVDGLACKSEAAQLHLHQGAGSIAKGLRAGLVILENVSRSLFGRLGLVAR
eukprot:2184022-Prorocentrum_lima.AAC.1